MSTPERSLDDLARRYLEDGDERAVEELIARTRPKLLRIARRIGAAQDAEDSVQTAYLSLARHRGDPIEAPVLPWLISAVVRIAYRRWAQERKQHLLAGLLSRPREEPTPAAAAGEADLLRWLRSEVARLPAPFQDVVVLHYFEGLRSVEVARLLDVPESTVRTRLHRSRALLREGWSPRAMYGLLLVPWLLQDSAFAATRFLLRAGVRRLVVTAALVLATFTVSLLLHWSDRAPGQTARTDAQTPALLLAPGATPGAEAHDGAAPAARPPKRGGVVLAGRVVDERRRPAARAMVTLMPPEGDPVRTRCGADGRFLVDAGPRPDQGWKTLGLHATDAARRRGAVGFWHLFPEGPQGEDVPTLVLGDACSLTVSVTCDGGPVEGAEVLTAIDSAAYRLHVDRAETDASGTVTFAGHPLEDTILVAAAPGCGRGILALAATNIPAEAVELALPRERTLEVRVVDEETGRAIPDARIEMRERVLRGAYVGWFGYRPLLAVPPTDTEGRTLIRGLGDGEGLHLKAIAPGHSLSPRWGMEVAPGSVEMTLALAHAPLRRWKVEPPGPEPGSRIRLIPFLDGDHFLLPASGRMELDELVVDGIGVGTLHFLAVAPDGSAADVTGGTETISFHPRRTIEVSLREPDGSPAGGVPVSVRGPFGRTARTDSSGRARIESLQGGRVEVWTLGTQHPLDDRPSRDPVGGYRIGTVDLDGGDARIEATVGQARDVVLRLSVAGRIGLPARHVLLAPGVMASDVAEDARTGELRFRVRAGPGAKQAEVEVQGEGLLAARASVDVAEQSGPAALALDLAPAGELHVRVLPPPYGFYMPLLWRWAPDGSPSWMFETHVPSKIAAWDHVTRFNRLAPGRYRVQDNLSGAATEPFDVASGGAPTAITLDLSRARRVRGHVEVPDGTNPTEVRVIHEERFQALHPHFLIRDLGRVKPDGSFLVTVPGDRPATLRPLHRFLVPAKENGMLRITTEDDVVLRLEKGPEAFFLPSIASNPGAVFRGNVFLYKDDPSGRPVSSHPLVLRDGAVRFRGFREGRYTLLVDLDGFVPVVLRARALEGRDVDLGIIELDHGSSIRILVPDGAVRPLSIRAFMLDAPRYLRAGDGNVLAGLGKGRYRVVVAQRPGAHKALPLLDRIVEVDGEHDVELELR